MTTAPGMRGETVGVYRLCQLFSANPNLHYHDITIKEDGRVQVNAVGANGVLRDWSRAIPDHNHHTALVSTSYGCDEADVLEGAGIVVTIRRPAPWGGVS